MRKLIVRTGDDPILNKLADDFLEISFQCDQEQKFLHKRVSDAQLRTPKQVLKNKELNPNQHFDEIIADINNEIERINKEITNLLLDLRIRTLSKKSQVWAKIRTRLKELDLLPNDYSRERYTLSFTGPKQVEALYIELNGKTYLPWYKKLLRLLGF